MVGTDELAFKPLSGYAVDDITIDLTITIDHTIFTREIFVLGMDMEGMRLLLLGPQFAAQIFIVRPKSELVGVQAIVSEAVVDIVVRDAGAGAEWYLATEVGEEVESVVVMMFRDGQFAVQYEPVDEVRQLTHTAADALRGLALGDGQPLLVALALSSATDEFPDGERLAGANQQPVDVLHRQGQVRSLVLLQLHVDITQPPTDERVVAIDHYGQ